MTVIDKESEVRKVNEKTSRNIKKTLRFEQSEETLSIQIELENVSPEKNKNNISTLLDSLYMEAKKVIL